MSSVAVGRLDQRDHHLAPSIVGHADDDAVEDVRMRAQRELDFLGVHLLAARVDARRAAAEEPDRAVGIDASRSRPGSNSDGRSTVRNVAAVFSGILVVAERDRAADAEHPDLSVAGLRDVAVVGDDDEPVAGLEARRRDVVVGARLGAGHDSFRRAERVDQRDASGGARAGRAWSRDST